jgi:hypothetical protein
VTSFPLIALSLLSGILAVSVVQCVLLATYLKRKKPGPKPRKKVGAARRISPKIASESQPPKRRFRARTYEERQMN